MGEDYHALPREKNGALNPGFHCWDISVKSGSRAVSLNADYIHRDLGSVTQADAVVTLI